MAVAGRRSAVVVAVAFVLCAPVGAVAQEATTTTKAPPSCRVADELATLKRQEAARTAYLEVLKADPSSPCAAVGLAKLPGPTDRCVAADQLADAEQLDEAKKEYVAALKDDPRSESCARTGLETLDDKRPLLDRVTSWVAQASRWVGLALFALVVALLLLRPFRRPSVELGAVTDGGAKEKVGSNVQAMVAHRLLNDPLLDIDVSTGPGVVQDLVAGVKELSTQGTVLAAALTAADRLVPENRFVVGGLLAPPAGRGVGLSLSMAKRGAVVSGHTTWEWPPGYVPNPAVTAETPARYYGLVRQAAAWVRWEVVQRSRRRPRFWVSDSADAERWFEGGLAAFEEKDFTLAESFWRSAREADPKHPGVLINLATIEQLHGHPHEAVELLLKAVEVLSAP